MSLKTELAEIQRRAEVTGFASLNDIQVILFHYRDSNDDESPAASIQRRMGGRPCLAAIQAIIDAYEAMMAERREVSRMEIEQFGHLGGKKHNWRREYASDAGQGEIF